MLLSSSELTVAEITSITGRVGGGGEEGRREGEKKGGREGKGRRSRRGWRKGRSIGYGNVVKCTCTCKLIQRDKAK